MAGVEEFIGHDERLRMVPTDREALRAAVDALWQGERSLNSLRRLGSGLTALGEYGAAKRVLVEALAWARSDGDVRGEVAARINLGDALRYAGELDAAEPQYVQALELARRCVPDRVDFALQHYGKHLVDSGRPQQAIACLEEALRLRRSKGDASLIASTTEALALALRESRG